MMGYASTRADLTNPSELSELFTGDLAMRNAQGLYRITGRKSRFAKIFGLRLSLDEIEAQLLTLGARGLAVSDDSIVVLGLPTSARHLNCAEKLSLAFDLPITVFRETYWSPLPTLASGKPDYQAVLRLGQVPKTTPLVADISPDAVIRTAFARAFPGKTVRDEDSFIGLGGDSLNYVAVSLDIELALGNLPEAWEQMTLARLCDLPARHRATSWWSLRWIESEIILRAVAVVCVVIVHASAWPLSNRAFW